MWLVTLLLRFWLLTTYCDFCVGCGQVDDVWHLFEELFSLIQQLQNISGMENLCGKKAVSHYEYLKQCQIKLKYLYLLLLKTIEESVCVGYREGKRQPRSGVGLWNSDCVEAGLSVQPGVDNRV